MGRDFLLYQVTDNKIYISSFRIENNKVETIHNYKIYYIQENEDEEVWELFFKEIK